MKGYERLLNWAEDFGPVRCAGVEGTSSCGGGLARHLRARGVEVLEVERRYEALSAEIAELDAQLDRLVAQAALELVSLPGIGTDAAATLLIVAGDNPQRG